MKLPMREQCATGEDADMWNNLDGCEDWEVVKTSKKPKNPSIVRWGMTRTDLAYSSSLY